MRGVIMKICYQCHQPITPGSTSGFDKTDTGNRYYHVGTEVSNGPYSSGLGCPTEDQVIRNLEIAIGYGFTPEFCRTHELYLKGPLP